MSARQIAFFGRPGVGTTTVVANIGAALAEAGHRVAVIGCGEDGRTTATLREGRVATSLLTAVSQTPKVELAQVAVTGFKGILCLELGKVAEAVETSAVLAVVAELLAGQALDYVLYNASAPGGDPATFVAPLLHNRQLDQLVAVSVAEIDSLQSVNRLLKLLCTIDKDRQVDMGGIIGNHLPAPYAEAIIDSFAMAVGIPVAAFIQQSIVVTRSAFFGASVIDAAPLAHHAYLYRKAARNLITNRPFSARRKPKPLEEAAFAEWALDWGERLYDLGEGHVGEGGGI